MLNNYLEIWYPSIRFENWKDACTGIRNHYLETIIGVLSILGILLMVVRSIYKPKIKELDRDKIKEFDRDKIKNFILLFAIPPGDPEESNNYTVLKIVLSSDSMFLINQIMYKYKSFRRKIRNMNNDSNDSKVLDFKYLPYILDKDGLRMETLDKDKGLVNNYDDRFRDIDNRLFEQLLNFEKPCHMPLNILDISKIGTDPGIIGIRYIYPSMSSDINHLIGMRDTFSEMHRDNPDKHDVDQMNSLIDFTIRYINNPKLKCLPNSSSNNTNQLVVRYYDDKEHPPLLEEFDIPDKIATRPGLGLDPSVSNDALDSLNDT